MRPHVSLGMGDLYIPPQLTMRPLGVVVVPCRATASGRSGRFSRQAEEEEPLDPTSVSYTHLTLPTKA